jgi:adenylate cyclase
MGIEMEGLPRECLAACLMTDAERYTAVSEEMQPSSVVQMINRYFEALFGPVLENGGVVSDVKGDGLLAVWNYESAGLDFKARACRACLEIVHTVEAFNRREPAHRLPTRLGVDFGPVAIARVGARERYEHRAVGDPVNTASRLEELNKVLHTRILVSEAFAQGVRGFVFRDVGSFHLRGKRAWTRVRELVGALDECDARTQDFCAEFSDAVRICGLGRDAEAERRFRALHARFPGDGATRYYLQRFASPRAEPGWLAALWPSEKHFAGRAK